MEVLILRLPQLRPLPAPQHHLRRLVQLRHLFTPLSCLRLTGSTLNYLADMPRVESPIWDEEDGPAGADRDALASSDEDDHSGNHGHGWDNERS